MTEPVDKTKHIFEPASTKVGSTSIPNKSTTTKSNSFGNGTGYTEGLYQNMYNPNVKVKSRFTGDSEDNFKHDIFNVPVSDVDSDSSTYSKAPWSIANRFALFTYGGFYGSSRDLSNDLYKNTVNNPITGGDTARDIGYDAEKLINIYSTSFPLTPYEYSDFLWCKHYKYLPLNHLITLRRFPIPVEDNIFDRETTTSNVTDKVWKEWKDKHDTWQALKNNPKKASTAGKEPVAPNGKVTNPDLKPDMARAVTWFGEETGNKLDEIMTFTYGYRYRTQTSETNTVELGSENSFTSHPFYSRMANRGGITGLLSSALIKKAAGVDESKVYAAEHGHPGFDPLTTTYSNFVIGPVNVINEMQTRDVGLTFDQSIKLEFNYGLKAIGDINPKIAFLDILANLFVLTYDNASFYGGANRFFGGKGYVAPRFGNDDKLRKGDFAGYLGSVFKSFNSGVKDLFGGGTGTFNKDNIGTGILATLGGAIGGFLGGFINSQMGAPPAALQIKGMITGEATGNWHMLVGNPLNPILTVGNLVLESSTISFSGPLSYDDFPSNIKLEVNLKHARPRDKSDFESMFNNGRGRLYAAPTGGDFLNLKGNDVPVYGAFQFGRNGTSHKKDRALNLKNDVGNSINPNTNQLYKNMSENVTSLIKETTLHTHF